MLLTEDLPETDWLAETEQRPDILCAFPHWDRRRAEYPSVRTQTRAGRLVERGVGLVAGHHMQRVQPVERVGATYVAYGLGMFHGGAPSADLRHRIGAMFVVDISTVSWERGQIAAYELFPFVRLAERNRERIAPLDALPHKQRRDVDAMIGHLSSKPSESGTGSRPATY